MPPTIYQRTQIAWPTIVPLAGVAAIITRTFLGAELVVGLWVTLGVLAVVFLLFATMTVTVTSDGLLASFGIGVVRKWIPFVEVASFARVRNRWISGWGIHTYPGGTLYNASGLSAIEFRMKSGRYVGIGTPDPDALVAAVQQAAGKAESAHEPAAGRTWGAQHTAAVAVGLIALVVAGSSFYFGFQPPEVTVTDDSFSVSHTLFHNSIPYGAMKSATLEVTLPRIVLRTNGFAAGDTMRGSFTLDEWGHGRLYINRNTPPFIVIHTDNSFLVVNFKDPAQTRAAFVDLTSHIDRSRR